MRVDKLVRKANTLIRLDQFLPLDALISTLKQHGLKIKGRDGDHYFIGNNKSTGIITRNNGHWEY